MDNEKITQNVVEPEVNNAVILEKKKKPFYKKWWFILLVIVAVLIAVLSFESKGEKIDWNDIVLSDMLPEPPAKRGEIYANSAEELRVDYSDVTSKEYADYVEECKSMGFDVDEYSDSLSYNAYSEDGYKLTLYHYDNREELSITVEAPMEMNTIKWPTSSAGKQLPTPKSLTGTFSYEHEDSFYVYIGDTSKTDYDEYVTACSDKGFDVDYDKGEDYYYADNAKGWHVTITYEGNNVMCISVDAPDDFDDNDTTSAETEKPKAETKVEETVANNSDEDLGSNFKAAMDSYESFMDEYVEFMKKYNENQSDLSLLADYADYMSDYADFVEDFEKWEDEDLSDAELAYYLDVQTRVTKKLLEVAN